MLWLFRFLNGEICVSLWGDRAEELLSKLAANGILLRRIHYKKKMIDVWMNRSGFCALRRYRKGTGVHVHIRRKTGMPFLLYRYRGRYGIPAGLIVFFAVTVFLSNFVWGVRVTGNDRIPAETVLSDAARIGLKSGQPIRRIDVKTDAQRLMLQSDRLAWASVNREGCYLEINISEIKNAVPDDRGEPRSLYAASDGIIRRLDIRSGTPCVKVGDAVSKGDLLVSGIVELPGSTSFVQAVGTVTAQVGFTVTEKHSVSENVAVPTGKIKRHTVIECFGIRVPLYLGDFSGEAKYHSDKKSLRLFGKQLPIGLSVRTQEPLRTEYVEYSRAQLEKILKKQTDSRLKSLKKEECRLISQTFSSDTNVMKLTSEFLCEENIAVSKKIFFSSSEIG